MSDFIFLGSKITADGDCSHEIKRRLLLGRKIITNLDSIFKSRDIALSTKVHQVKAMVFPMVMYGCAGVLGTGLPGLGTEHLPGALCSGTGSPALHHDPSIMGGLHGMAHGFIELDKAVATVHGVAKSQSGLKQLHFISFHS